MADWKLHYPFGSPKYVNTHGMAMLDEMRAKRKPEPGEHAVGEVGEFGVMHVITGKKLVAEG